MSAILTVQDVYKSFGPREVLRGVSFALGEKDRAALVGLNGAGKSTLLRLVAAVGGDEGLRGDYTADGGLITRRRDLSMVYVPQEPVLDPQEPVLESLRAGLKAQRALHDRLAAVEAEIPLLSGPQLEAALHAQAALHERIAQLGAWDAEHELRGIAAALRLPPFEALVGTLSIGERRRVALGRALLGRPELLLLDEPTNHLDARTVEWLEERLRELPGALLLVTHDRYFLDRVATRIFEIDRGALYAYEGGYSRFVEKQGERLATEAVQDQKRASFIRRELDWVRRGPSARGTKQKARLDRFADAVADAGEARQRQLPDATDFGLRLPFTQRLGKTILELRGVSKSLGGKTLLRDLSLILKPGDRIGVVGPNGAGKTSLMRMILGEIQPDAGEIFVGQNTRLAVLDQGRAELDDGRSVLEEVAGDNDFVMLPDGKAHVRTFLRRMLFDDRFADAKVGTLSGGERNRVQLAKLLRQGGNVILLDEPTNDLDLFTLGVLEEALSTFPGCAIIVSHDRWFLDRVATGILAFSGDGGDGRAVFYEGNYSDYLARRPAPEPERPEPKADKKPEAKAEPKADKRPERRRLSYREQQELAGMEAAIMAAEERVAGLEARLADPSLYKDRGGEVAGLTAELDAAKGQVEALYSRWQVLSEQEQAAKG